MDSYLPDAGGRSGDGTGFVVAHEERPTAESGVRRLLSGEQIEIGVAASPRELDVEGGSAGGYFNPQVLPTAQSARQRLRDARTGLCLGVCWT
jgi:hypothetical protein